MTRGNDRLLSGPQEFVFWIDSTLIDPFFINWVCRDKINVCQYIRWLIMYVGTKSWFCCKYRVSQSTFFRMFSTNKFFAFWIYQLLRKSETMASQFFARSKTYFQIKLAIFVLFPHFDSTVNLLLNGSLLDAFKRLREIVKLSKICLKNRVEIPGKSASICSAKNKLGIFL